MARKANTYDDLLAMAVRYGVAGNALFVAAAKQYAVQSQVIEKMQQELNDMDATVEKEYVKGRQNVCVNPLIQNLPKHIDSANKTLATMLEIITKLGHEVAAGDKLGEFLNE